MGVKLVVAVTDGDGFDHLRARPHLTEVNFWSQSDWTFHALEPGELFLFNLHAPRNSIVGGGWFAHSTILPCSCFFEPAPDRVLDALVSPSDMHPGRSGTLARNLPPSSYSGSPRTA